MSVLGDNVDIDDEELKDMQMLVRAQIRDFAPKNITLDGIEFENDDIRRAMRLATAQVNSMTPTSNYKWRDLPEHILFTGTTRYLMQSESFLQIRNQVSIQGDDLGAVGLDDKFQLYNRIEQQLNQEFMRATRNWKNQKNMERCFGSISSGYRETSRFNN